jgi:MFS family permease
VLAAPMLTSAVALPLLGKLGDLYGHRRVFLLGSAAAATTAFATCFAWNAPSLISCRTMAAMVGAATQPTAMALIFSVTPRESRVRAMGWWSMTGAGAPMIGLVAGGPLVEWLGWRVIFAMQGGLQLVALSTAFVILRETEKQRVRLDVGGVATLALGVAGLMLALSEIAGHPIGSLRVLAPFAFGVAFLAIFWRVEQRVEAPLLPPALLRRRAFTAPLAANAFTSASYMGAFAVAPYLLAKLFGLSTSLVTWILLLRTASYTFSSPFGGALGQRLGERSAAWIGCAVMAVAMAILASAAHASMLAGVCVGLVLQGIAYGLCTPSITTAASNAGTEEELGMTSAVSRLMGSVGSAFGVTLLTLLYGGNATADGFQTTFRAGGALAVAALAASLAMRRERIGAHRELTVD